MQKIEVLQDGDFNNIFETTIRSYFLSYGEDVGGGYIFPNYTRDSGNGHISTLRSISQSGVAGMAFLPATLFAYGDGMHLTKAENGYGGRVEFDLDSIYSELENTAENSIIDYDFGKQGICEPVDGAVTSSSHWYAANASSTATLYCNQLNPAVTINGRIHRWNIVSNSGLYLLLPGRTYRITAEATALTPGATWRIGVGNWATEYAVSSASIGTLSRTFTMGTNAHRITAYMDSTNGSVTITNYKIEVLPTFYRVSQKRLYSSSTADPYVFSYSYTNPHMNDPLVSEAVYNCPSASNGCKQYVEQYTQFRGHEKVTVTDPYGKVTITTYQQNDRLKGRPSIVEVKVGDTLYYANYYNYSFVEHTDMAPLVTPQGIPYQGVKRFFIFTSQDERHIYGNGVDNYIRNIYSYNTFGNLTNKKEYENGGLYRETENFYFYNTSAAKYLPGLVAKTKIYDGSGVEKGVTIYLYGSNTGNHEVSPENSLLTSIRTKAASTFEYNQVSYEYDAWGNRTKQTVYTDYATLYANPPGGAQVTLTQYDPNYHTYPISIANPLNQKTSFTYSYTYSAPLSMTDVNDKVTQATYDFLGRLATITRPLDGSPAISIAYPATNPFRTTMTLKVDAQTNYTVERTYDGMGRITRTVDGGIKTDFLYNAYGQVTRQSVPFTTSELASTSTTYDPLGRVVSVTAPGNSVVSYSYNGLVTTVTKPDSTGTTSETTTTDVWGRTTSVQPEIGPSVTYKYDILNHLIEAKRSTQTTELFYDFAGNKIKMIDPDMGTWYYTYNALGSLTRQTDARGQRICMYYDKLNRLVGKHYRTDDTCPASPTTYDVTYKFDEGGNGVGRRTSMADDSGSTAWNYDDRGRLASEEKIISGNSFTTKWEYNLADLPTLIIYPDDERVTQTYNSRMLINSLGGTNTYVSSTTYDTVGRVTQRMIGNNTLTNTFVYSDWNSPAGGRLQSILASNNANGYIIQHLNYGYDLAGNVTSIDNVAANHETQSYEYDALDRLISWKLGNVTENYSYDASSGNLISKNNIPYTYSSAHPHAVQSVGSPVIVSDFNYDANGNMTDRNVPGMTTDFTYDAEGHLVFAAGSANPTVTPLASPTPVSATATASPIPTITPSFTPVPTKTSTLQPTVTPLPTATATPIFADVLSGVHKPFIEAFYKRGISGGCSSNPLRFCPTSNVTRSEMAVFLVRAKYFGTGYNVYNDPATAIQQFTDVPSTHWAFRFINKLRLDNITSGCGSGNYCPDIPATRDQFAILVLRAKNGGGWNPSTYSAPYAYNDIDNSYAKNWIQALASVYGIIDFCTSGSYCPTNNLTRERAAFLIMRVFNNIPLASEPETASLAVVTMPDAPRQDATSLEAITAKLMSTPPLPDNITGGASKVMADMARFAQQQAISISATFTYDGNGQRVKSVIGNVTTYFVGNHYEVTVDSVTSITTVTKYYFAGTQRIAMRKGGVLTYMLSDHLGSASLMTDSAGAVISETRYTAWGEVRYQAGTTSTGYTYTGQYSNTADFGLMYYNARWYDPQLGRFAQADTIVPAGVQGYDRYAYVNNNPVRYTDPSGHMADDGDDGGAVTIPRHPITSSSDDNEEDEENDLKDNTPSLDDFDLKNCDDGPYICKGDSDVGYVYDSQTGLLATWVDGIENVKYSSFNPKNQDKVTINLSKFMEKIDAYQAAKTVRVISGVSAVVGVGSLVLLAIFIPTPAAPASIAAFSVAFVETSVATGVFINSINDVNTARKDAVDYWNGVP